MRRVVIMLSAILALAGSNALGQGTFRFTTTILGFETRSPGAPQVRGFGNLTLTIASSRSDGSLAYDFTVPLSRAFPLEAHFHGPAIAGENPIISLAPYQLESGGIRYAGSLSLDRKWLADLQAGSWYINLHNPAYENAIISGTIAPVVPEPGALALLALGSAMLAYARESSRKS